MEKECLFKLSAKEHKKVLQLAIEKSALERVAEVNTNHIIQSMAKINRKELEFWRTLRTEHPEEIGDFKDQYYINHDTASVYLKKD
jgi:hypothetical protein